MSFFGGQRVFDFYRFSPGRFGPVDFGEHCDGFVAATHLHQPARTLDGRKNHHAEEDCRDHTGEKHPAPAGRNIPGFVAHALNQHVDEDRSENSADDAELVERHAPAADASRRDFRDVVRRNPRRGAYPPPADQPPQYKLMKIGREENSNGRKRETKRAKPEPFFLAKIIGDGSGSGATDDASYQCARSSPAHARRVEVKQLAQISNRSTYHNVVVAEEQTTQGGDNGGDDQRSSRMSRSGGGSQFIFGPGRQVPPLYRIVAEIRARPWPPA